MVLKYRFLGKGYTDENGVAHMTEDADGQSVAGYTGTGRGLTDVVASTDDKDNIKESSLQSETYSLWDTIFYDDGITDPKTATWYNYNNLINVSISNNGTSLTPSQTYVGYQAKNGALFSYPFAVEFTVVDYTESPQLRLTAQNGSTQYGVLNLNHNGVYKVLVQESGITALLDGESTEIYTTTWNHEDMKAQFFFDSVSDRITFKDFKVYSI